MVGRLLHQCKDEQPFEKEHRSSLSVRPPTHTHSLARCRRRLYIGVVPRGAHTIFIFIFISLIDSIRLSSPKLNSIDLLWMESIRNLGPFDWFGLGEGARLAWPGLAGSI
jgi:hypothetical protein